MEFVLNVMIDHTWALMENANKFQNYVKLMINQMEDAKAAMQDIA